MRKVILLLMLAAPAFLGQTTKNQVGPEGQTPQQIASEFMASSSVIAPDDLSSVYLAKQYTTAHNGVTHLVYKQRFQGFDVYNGAWIANIGTDGRVLNTGGTLFSAPQFVDVITQLPSLIAAQTAVHEVNPRQKHDLKPLAVSDSKAKANVVRYAVEGDPDGVEGRMVWYAHRGNLVLAWMFNVLAEDGVSAYNVFVEASSGAVIAKQATTFFQAAPKGLVFDKGTPQPNPNPGTQLTSAPPLVERVLVPLTGDPVASPQGWVINNETAGYNTIVGENVLGQQLITTARRTVAPNGDFSFPLTLGPTAPSPVVFPDAANVNLFYWMNRAHDMFYRYGFDEAAGNFQLSNYGRGGAEGDAILAYTHYGAAATSIPALNNAFFGSRDTTDGTASMIAMYIGNTGAGGFLSDAAYTALVSLHEYTHGVSLRLLPDGYGSLQTAAMGEAWSDFFALEFTVPESSPADGIYPMDEYWLQNWGVGIRTRPYSTNMAVNPLTFADYAHVLFIGEEVHADGEIWVEALWDARANLINQFGDAEGRRRIRQLVIDGLKLAPPSPSMVDARDAILLADQVDFNGASQTQLWSAFAKRGLGALAHSDGGDTVHVIPSFEVPSATAKIKLYENTYVAGELVRVLLSDLNYTQPAVQVQLTTTSGDVEDLMLARTGFVYYGAIPSSSNVVNRQNGTINIIPGDELKVSYNDTDLGFFFGSGPATLVQATSATQQPYTIFTSSTPSTGLPPFPNEVRLASSRATVLLDLGFDFPFFSKKYRSAIIHPNGTLIFEPSASTALGLAGCTDVFELRRMVAVAPLLTQLTIGTAQPNEGIYASLTANSVTIRWAAETLPAVPLVAPAIPEPVNVALTINAEGIIMFQYGSGNQNLHLAAPTFSDCGTQPVVGISNGHDVYSVTFPLRTYTNAPSISFAPPFNAPGTPEVFVETPKPGDTVRGVMRVTGIAYNPTGTLSALIRREVFIDGIERTTAATTVSRPDYCATNTVPGCPNVGFQTELNLATLNLAAGPHTVWVRATNTRGAFKDSAPVSFIVDTAPARLPIGAIEAPLAGTEVSGTAVEFRGYAYAPDLRVSRVDLLIDGITYPGALFGFTRSDICNLLPAPLPPNCAAVGWSAIVNTRTGTPALPDGPHSAQIRVQDETGRFTLLPDQPVPFSVRNGPQTLPIGAVTSIKPGDRLSGVVRITGYAYSPGGTIPSSTGVLLVVDGVGLSFAQYGQPRPVECGTLTGVAACPNIGFTVDLDTRTLTNGNHVIGLRIVNSAGLSVFVPNVVRNGMNVVVDNP